MKSRTRFLTSSSVSQVFEKIIVLFRVMYNGEMMDSLISVKTFSEILPSQKALNCRELTVLGTYIFKYILNSLIYSISPQIRP